MTVYKDKERGTYYFIVRIKQPNGSYKQVKRRGFKSRPEAVKAEAEMILTEPEEIEVENFTSHNQLPIFMIRLRHQTQSYQANLFWEMMKGFSPFTGSDV